MKVVFLSNFYNHHQQPFSEKMYELTAGGYRFIATTKVPESRKQMGYYDDRPGFLLRYYEENERAEAQRLIGEADIVISGGKGEDCLSRRKRKKKVIIRCSERPLKNGFEVLKYPYRWIGWHRMNPRGVPIYLLCASAFAAGDYAAFGMFKNKRMKWGYFPRFIKYENINTIIEEKNKREILWCGRFLDWKHPDDVLRLAKRLKDSGRDFHISMIGTGEMEETLNDLCRELDVEDKVSLIGAMPPEEVREKMKNAGVFLLTSDRKEGWGAVLNEAMNSACAVIGTKEAGSVPYLIKDRENGIIYSSGDVDALYDSVSCLLDAPAEQARLGKAAYQTISDEWNPDIATERLFSVCKVILGGGDINTLFSSGPCSPG